MAATDRNPRVKKLETQCGNYNYQRQRPVLQAFIFGFTDSWNTARRILDADFNQRQTNHGNHQTRDQRRQSKTDSAKKRRLAWQAWQIPPTKTPHMTMPMRHLYRRPVESRSG